MALAIATFVSVTVSYDNAFGVGLAAFGLAVTSPLAYPLVGPYLAVWFVLVFFGLSEWAMGQI